MWAPVVRHSRLVLLASAVAIDACGATAATPDTLGVVSIETDVQADSVTVGERFDVVYKISFPDTLRMVDPERFEVGRSRVVGTQWGEERAETGYLVRTARVSLIPLELETAVVPSIPFSFVTPNGDTLRATSDEAVVPIRRLTRAGSDLRPLKAQWEAPPSYGRWAIIAAAAVAVLAAVVWLVRRRRSRRAAPSAPEVRLPPDYVALAELERIERMGLVERGELKVYYTLIVDTVRRYLEGRFGMDAMDRTTHELLDDLARRGVSVPEVGTLLEEADLVKFAKLVPAVGTARAAIERARDIVTATTPRAATAEALA